MKKSKFFLKLLGVTMCALFTLGTTMTVLSCSSGSDDSPTEQNQGGGNQNGNGQGGNQPTTYKCSNCDTEYDTQEKAKNCAVKSGCPKYVPESTDGLPNTSIAMAKAMTVGWNLGNTLDAGWYNNKSNDINTEELWGMPKTTQAMINTIADKGFKTIRIPVSWHNHITDETNLIIDPLWLSRVKEVVDWARSKDMFVIINIHHDNLSSNGTDSDGNDISITNNYGFTVNTNTTENTTSINYISKIWTQVATYFKDYDEHLIFELLNEPRNRDGTNDGFDAPSNLSDLNKIIAKYEQTALNAVRATGGINASRFVMVPYYAAQPWSSTGWTPPTDTTANGKNKILISTHAYDPYTFAMGTMNNRDFSEDVEGKELGYLFNELKTKWVDNGYGVVMGEASCTDKKNLDERLAWFESYISKAKAINCPVILWDNMTVCDKEITDMESYCGEFHGYFDRENLTWFYPTLVEKMITCAGSTPSNEPPAEDPPANPTKVKIQLSKHTSDSGNGTDENADSVTCDGVTARITPDNFKNSGVKVGDYIYFTVGKTADENMYKLTDWSWTDLQIKLLNIETGVEIENQRKSGTYKDDNNQDQTWEKYCVFGSFKFLVTQEIYNKISETSLETNDSSGCVFSDFYYISSN